MLTKTHCTHSYSHENAFKIKNIGHPIAQFILITPTLHLNNLFALNSLEISRPTSVGHLHSITITNSHLDGNSSSNILFPFVFFFVLLIHAAAEPDQGSLRPDDDKQAKLDFKLKKFFFSCFDFFYFFSSFSSYLFFLLFFLLTLPLFLRRAVPNQFACFSGIASVSKYFPLVFCAYMRKTQH